MNHFQRILVMSLAASLCACGGSPGSVSGTVHGNTFSIKDAVSASVPLQDSNGNTIGHTAEIALGTTSGLCNDIKNIVEHPNEKILLIAAADVSGMTVTTPTKAGTYTITGSSVMSLPPKTAFLTASVLDGSCKGVSASSANGASGTVTLTGVSGDTFSGSFDAMLDSGDHITGSFSPEACPALATAVNSTMMPSCM